MADTDVSDEHASHLLRWILLVAVAIGMVAAGRQWALTKADKEFEARLMAADERRN